MGLMVEESREAKKYVRRLQGIIAEEIKNNRMSYELNITEEDSIDISESIKYMYNADIENLGSVVKIVGKDVSSRDSVVKIHGFLENELATFRDESREIKNRQYSQDELDEVNEIRKELRLEEFISQNKYIPIFGELFNVLYSDELESRIVAEAVLIAKIIASTHGVMVCSTMNIHSAVVAYWAFNVNKKLRLKSNSGALAFTLKDDKDKLYNIEEISFREFLKKLFKEDDAVNLAIKYLKEFGKEEHRADRAFVGFLEDFIRVIKKQLKNDKDNIMLQHKQSIEDEYEKLLEREYSKYEIKQINRSNKENQVYAAIARSFVFGYDVEMHPAFKGRMHARVCTLHRSFIIAEYINWKKNKRVNKLDWLYGEMLHSEDEARALLYQAIFDIQRVRIRDIEGTWSELENTKDKIKEIEERYTEIKKRAKSAEKSAKMLEDEVSKREKQIKKLKDSMQSEIKREDHEKIKNELDKCRESLDKANGDNLNLNRSLGKKDKEIAEAYQKMDKLETEYLELLEKYEREHKLNSQLSVDRQFSSIPMACFVNAIKDKNIVVIGGDRIHSKLRDYGLNNMRLYKAGCRELSNEDIINTDIIVIITPYVDHASIEVVTRAARNHDLKLLNFNNKNVDMLIRRIFEELNK